MSNFLSSEEYYDVLVEGLPQTTRDALDSMRHVRVEPAYRNRKFIVYRMDLRHPEKLATLNILDYVCNDEDGSTTQIEWMERPGSIITIGHTPTKVFDFPIFAHIPLSQKTRWGVRTDDVDDPSLSFLLVLRTQSRRHLRERDVVYMESNKAFQLEFFPKPVA